MSTRHFFSSLLEEIHDSRTSIEETLRNGVQEIGRSIESVSEVLNRIAVLLNRHETTEIQSRSRNRNKLKRKRKSQGLRPPGDDEIQPTEMDVNRAKKALRSKGYYEP